LNILGLSQIGQKLPSDHVRDENYYIQQFDTAPELLLAAYLKDKLIGVCLGTLESRQVLIGEFVIDKNHRRQKIGSELLRTMENRTIKLGVKSIYLGADIKAEPFYLKHMYKPELFVQTSGDNAKEELDKLIKDRFSGLRVIWRENMTNISKVIVLTKGIDNKLRKQVKRCLPKANVIYLFTKKLKSKNC